MSNTIIKAAGAAVALAGALWVGREALAEYEEPSFTVVGESGGMELRHYAPMLLAVTEVEGPYDDALSEGFRRIASFIFGENVAGDRIAMTAPVSAQREGAEIPRTAPVSASPGEGESWQVSFMMPSSYTLETIPRPKDERITLVEVPQRLVAVHRFSGRITHAAPEQELAQLRAWTESQGMKAAGPPVIAQFDAPWKPGFLRRNEVQLPIAPETPPAHGAPGVH